MSLIIEDKDRLNALADTIINANGSNATQPATVEELKEQISNLIPLKSKFASGVVIPATEISINNMPEIPFNLGNDDNGKPIIPDMILIYQPQPIEDGSTLETCNIVTMFFPKLVRILTPGSEQLMTGYSHYKKTEQNYNSGSIYGANYEYTRITDSSFFLAPHKLYLWKAQQPIVWMQFKF